MKRAFVLCLALLLLLGGCAREQEAVYTVSVADGVLTVAESPEATAALAARGEELGASCALSGQHGAVLSLVWTLPDGTELRENRSAADGALLPFEAVWDLVLVSDLLTRNDWYEAEPASAAAWAQSLEPEEMRARLREADGYLTEDALVILLPEGTFTILQRNITLY